MKLEDLPIFSAKAMNSDEYVEGFYMFDGVRYFLLVDKGNLVQTQIKSTTLAIHHPKMTDSADTPIFASLNKLDGTGASKLEYVASGSTQNYKTYGYLYYDQENFSFEFCALGFHKDIKRNTPKDSLEPRFDMDFRKRYKDTLKVIGRI